MRDLSVDYSELQDKLSRKKAYKLEDVSHRIKKVAFDVVRFVDKSDSIDGLWQIHKSNDGDYIVAMYDNEQGEQIKSSSNWNAVSDKSGKFINIFYNDTPVTRISLSSLGLPNEEAKSVCGFLPEKLASSEGLTVSLLAGLPESQLKDLFATHEELNSKYFTKVAEKRRDA